MLRCEHCGITGHANESGWARLDIRRTKAGCIIFESDQQVIYLCENCDEAFRAKDKLAENSDLHTVLETKNAALKMEVKALEVADTHWRSVVENLSLNIRTEDEVRGYWRGREAEAAKKSGARAKLAKKVAVVAALITDAWEEGYKTRGEDHNIDKDPHGRRYWSTSGTRTRLREILEKI